MKWTEGQTDGHVDHTIIHPIIDGRIKNPPKFDSLHILERQINFQIKRNFQETQNDTDNFKFIHLIIQWYKMSGFELKILET
jgi:hypothetical protein